MIPLHSKAKQKENPNQLINKMNNYKEILKLYVKKYVINTMEEFIILFDCTKIQIQFQC